MEQLSSAGSKLHAIIADHAQCYVYRRECVQDIHASMEGYAASYRGDSVNAKDDDFEALQQMRITRQAILAAIGRIVSDDIIKKALTFSTPKGLDIARMTKNITPTYDNGMAYFLEETAEESLYSMTDSAHLHHELLRHAYDFEAGYLARMGRYIKKIGAMAMLPEPYDIFTHMFSQNYRNDVASFLVTQGISIQSQYGELPDADTFVKATAETRAHWLGLAALSRIHIGNLYFGTERYKRILDTADRTGNFPTWATLWPDGIAAAMAHNKAPFQTCPMQSPLLNRKPGDPIVQNIKSPGRCAGQIALYGSPEANENAIRFSSLVGGELTETGQYSPAALLIDLGRTASQLSFNDPAFRKALIEARKVRDDMVR